MRHALLVLLLAAPVFAQTVYEWTDEAGDVHYTDDPSTIPKKAKTRTTQGAEISTMKWDRPAPAPVPPSVDAGVPTAAPAVVKPERNLCAEGKAKIAELEQTIADTKRRDEERMAEQRNRCQRGLLRRGTGAYATCMAEPVVPDPAVERQVARLNEQLEVAREDLRKVQITGCYE